MGASKCAAFTEDVGPRWTIPVKNTFINFDMPSPQGAARLRSVTCPCSSSRRSWEHAIQEMCHAMVPSRQPQPPPRAQPQQQHQQLQHQRQPQHPQQHQLQHQRPQQQLQLQQQQQKQQPQCARRAPQSGAAETPASPACVDAISEVSTMSSDRVSSDGGGQPVASGKDGFSPGASTPGTASGAASPSSAQAWSSVPSKAKSGAALGKAQGKGAGAGGRATGGSPSSAVTVAAAVVSPSNSVAARPSPKARPGDASKGEGKGRGLQFFRKIEVGVEDEPDFRVVSRLIGPKGRHMQDILNEAKGTKIWIIGKGSRSWEDDVGPLIVCVGAGSSMAFETAVRLVEELLGRIKEDHRRFLQNQQ